MYTGTEYAIQAKLAKYDKLKYSDADCQAFCELVLKDLGVRDSSGKPYNWKGSNDIARHACSWVGTKEECIQLFGEIPPGAWAFIWDNTTGREKDRGYYDGLGNYSHIGIYVGNNIVRDSTRYKNNQGQFVRDGVADRNVSAFNRIGLAEMLDFNKEIQYNNHDGMIKIISEIRNKLNELERMV